MNRVERILAPLQQEICRLSETNAATKEKNAAQEQEITALTETNAAQLMEMNAALQVNAAQQLTIAAQQ
jgi:hypothetical protein